MTVPRIMITFIGRKGSFLPRNISGAHFVINRAWALHHKLGQSELLTDPQLRHPDDSVEGQLINEQTYRETCRLS